ncbi:MAG: class I SAM-dependent methyltransferase [Bdellovibrionales bacterium]|nr:class I SAM-dependent methyltransferase [Bdellovibrionales bacterium]
MEITSACLLCETPQATPPRWQRPEGEGGQAARRFHLCAHCDLVYVDPADHPSPEAERAHYSTHENDPADPRYAEFLNRALLPLAERIAPGSRGLDFGSGPGPAVASLLSERGHSVMNYDPLFAPDSALLWARYDFVTVTEVAEHFRRPREEWVLLGQLLKPRAWLAVMTETRAPAEDMRSWWYAKDPTHLCFYSRKTLEFIARWLQLEAEFPHRNVALFRKRG